MGIVECVIGAQLVIAGANISAVKPTVQYVQQGNIFHVTATYDQEEGRTALGVSIVPVDEPVQGKWRQCAAAKLNYVARDVSPKHFASKEALVSFKYDLNLPGSCQGAAILFIVLGDKRVHHPFALAGQASPKMSGAGTTGEKTKKTVKVSVPPKEVQMAIDEAFDEDKQPRLHNAVVEKR